MMVLKHDVWHLEHIKIIKMTRLIYMKMSIITKFEKFKNFLKFQEQLKIKQIILSTKRKMF